MRHDSMRVPRKNFRLFAGRPLYHHIIETLLSCSSLGEIVIDTNSQVIMEDAAEHYPSVRLLKRPASLCDDKVPMNEVLLNTVSQLDGENYLQTHSTNPLLRAATIDRALAVFHESTPQFDSLFSVTRLQTRLWNTDSKPVNHDPAVLLRTQDLPPVFEENSCFYVFTREILEQRRNRIGASPKLFEVERLEAWDIDQPEDFVIAESLYRDGLPGKIALDP